MKLMSFKKDFLANTLHSASLINIFFSPEHSNSEYTIANGSLPLFDILDKPDYIKYTPHLKKKHVIFLSQLLLGDGSFLARWDELALTLPFKKCSASQKWFEALKKKLNLQSPSHRLVNPVSVNRLHIPAPIPNNYNAHARTKDWVAFDDSHDNIIYGRIASRKASKHQVTLVHWI